MQNIKLTLKVKSFRIWACGQNIYEFENETNPRGYSDPVLGLYTFIYYDLCSHLKDAFT